MLKTILQELKDHAPFTAFGALTGILVMILFQRLPQETAYTIFYILHPTHVVFSALVTASMYQIHKRRPANARHHLGLLLVIGYVGSIGIATLSDSVIPYLAEALLAMPNRRVHIGFIEEWWLVNPLAFAGIAIAYFRPTTKMPHTGHVLLSTWASLFHVIMAMGVGVDPLTCLVIFVFLLLAVWLPCCVSDIAFPLLFAGSSEEGHS